MDDNTASLYVRHNWRGYANATKNSSFIVPRPGAFPDELAIIVAEVRTAHEIAVNGQGPEADRIRRRNLKIRSLFSAFAEKRASAYEASLYEATGSLTATNTQGTGLHSKNGYVQFPLDMEVIYSSISRHGDGHKPFKDGPYYYVIDQRLAFKIGKTGNGSNTGGYTARSRYTVSSIQLYTERDLQRIRVELANFGLPDDRAPDPT
jgi:hypothetical protein